MNWLNVFIPDKIWLICYFALKDWKESNRAKDVKIQQLTKNINELDDKMNEVGFMILVVLINLT